jgi:hypothetical protein
MWCDVYDGWFLSAALVEKGYAYVLSAGVDWFLIIT